ncbi:MAG: ABC transporter ATP-binding protein [Desulfocapsa sp.]|nr:MAG: ABC transporter ATP-binding protein [Desulfocapsa sp.]
MQVTKRSLYYWILHRHYRLQLLLLFIIVLSLFFRIIPLEMQKRIVNQAIQLKDYQLLFLYCGIYFAAVLLAGVSKYAINYLQVLIGQKILVEIRSRLYRHILRLPLQFYHSMQPGTVISAMTAELNAIGFFIGSALAVPVTAVLSYLAFFGFMFSISPLLALLSSLLYPLELLIIPRLQQRYNAWNRKRIKTIRAMSNVVNEAVSGISDVQSYNSFHLEEHRLQHYIKSLYVSLKRLFRIKYGIKFTDNLIQSFGPLLLFLVGGTLTIKGQFTLGALVAFLSAYEKIYDPWKEMLAFYQSYQDAHVRYRQIMKTFDLQPIPELMAPREKPLQHLGRVSLENVGYTLADGTQLLGGINLRIQAGEQVAVVGFSGSGKSTLALLINRLYKVTEGRILLDGCDIATLSKADISSNITMISQKPFIFSGTILDNLLYGLKHSGKDTTPLPEQKQIFQLLYDIGFAEDVLWIGINSVIPEEQVQKYRHHFLAMRKIVHLELREQFEDVIEFYDVNKFLYYASIRDNLIFGDCKDGSLKGEYLLENEYFIRLLRECDLEKDLLRLGIALARVSLDLLQENDRVLDPAFFATTPLQIDEIELYSDLITQLEFHPLQKMREKQLLLLLALRYIPAKHNVVSLSADLEKKIFLARHYFLNKIAHVDIHACHAASKKFLAGADLPGININEQDANFIAYCSIRYLYHHSLRTNILFGSVKKSDKDILKLRSVVWKAFREHGLLEEILSIGLNFNVGSQGSKLSGGQQQKLSLARGLLQKTPVLILDEATSALDNKSQAQVQSLLTTQCRGKTTVIAVIHRLDLTKHYDRIVVMKNGIIVEEGNYETLLEQQGDFYRLVRGNSNSLDG